MRTGTGVGLVCLPLLRMPSLEHIYCGTGNCLCTNFIPIV